MMGTARFLSAIVLALGFALPAAADYDAGLDAYRSGNLELAFSEWMAAAQAGDARAQYGIGAMYRSGDGAEPDAEQAARWYRLAAEQDYAPAQYNLGVLYQKGAGVEKDNRLAAEWYLKAARQDFIKAQFNLAVLYQMGSGVERDLVEAAAWYRVAAAQRDAYAFDRYRRLAADMTPEERAAVDSRARELMQAREDI